MRKTHQLSGNELIEFISKKSKHRENYFNEFYQRYKTYVWKTAYYYCRRSANVQLRAEQVLIDSFMNVYDNSDRFTPDSTKSDARVKLWLAGIVRNNFLKSMRDEKCSILLEESVLMSIPIESTCTEEAKGSNQNILEKAIQQLSQKEREILFLLLSYQSVRDIPEDILNHITDTYSLKKSSLRKVKLRSIDKLKKITAEMTIISRNNEDLTPSYSS